MAENISIKVFGDKQLFGNLVAAGAQAPVAVARALWVEANEMISASVPLVPVRDGILRGSHVVGTPKISGPKISVTFGYGGAARDYAEVQHERLDFQHTVGQAKYLSTVVETRAPNVPRRMVDTLTAMFRRL